MDSEYRQEDLEAIQVLRVIVGHLCHFFTVRRPALATLSAVWKFIEDARDEVRWLPDQVVNELCVARGLLPVLGHNLASELAPAAYVTGASTAGYAVLTTRLSDDEAWALIEYEERWRFHPRLVGSAGHWTSAGAAETGRADPPSGDFTRWFDEDDDAENGADQTDESLRLLDRWDGRRVPPTRRAFDEVASSVPAVHEAISQPSRWGRVICGGWCRAEAIHNKECRASLLALRRESAHSDFGDTILIGLGDNLSEILSTSRGRARNCELNSLCRVAAAYQISSAMTWRRRHVVSAANPADYDSRLEDRFIVGAGETLSAGAMRRRLAARRVEDLSGVSRIVVDSRLEVQRGSDGNGRSARMVNGALGDAGGKVTRETVREKRGVEPPRPRTTPSKASALAGADRYLLEVFAGSCRISAAAAERGRLITEPIEVMHGPWSNLLDRRVERVVRNWILSGRVWAVWFAPPCARWSTARTTGRAGSEADVNGLRCAQAMLRLLRACETKHVKYVIENPARSALFAWEPLRSHLERCGAVSARLDQCRFNRPYRKPTLLVGTLDGLESWSRSCRMNVCRGARS